MSAPKTIAAFVALAALFGGVAWWLVHDAAFDANPAFESPDAVVVPSRPSLAPPRAADSDEAVPTPIASEAFVEPDDALGEPREFESWPKDGVPLEVVMRDSGEPAKDAEVLWFEIGEVDGDRWTRLDIMRHDPEDTARRLARRFRTDDEGRCVVPYCKDLTLVLARSGGFFGGKRFSPITKGPQRVELAPDEVVKVRVRRADESPVADVPVDVCSVNGPRVEQFLKYVTDASGVAVCKNLGPFLALSKRDPKAAARVGVPIPDRAVVRFAPTPPPSEPIDLVLPALGEATLLVVDASDSHLALEGYATLRVIGRRDGGSIESIGEARSRVSGGVARFPFVGLGLRVAVDVTLADGSKAHGKADGPVEDGESVEILARRSSVGPDLVGVAVDPEGNPLGDRRIEARGFGPGSRLASGFRREIRTMSDGSFRVALFDDAEASKRGAAPDLFEFRGLDAAMSAFSASAAVPASSLEGATDVALGRIVFDRAPALVSGVVVDETGGPIRFARIEVWRKVVAEDLPIARGKTPSHTREEGLDVRADELGTFVVRGVRPAESTFSLRATRPGYAYEAKAEARSGAEDVRLVLTRGGVVAARWLLDDDVPRDLLRGRIRVYASASAREQKPIFQRETHVEPDGSFAWDGVPAGSATVDLLTPSFSKEPIESIAGIEIRADEASVDTRLNPWDLRGRLRLVELEAVDGGGRGVRDAAYETLPTGFSGVREDLRGGRARILAPAVAFDVRVSAPKLRSCLLTAPSGFVRAILPDPQIVRLQIPGALPTLPEDVDLVAALTPWPRAGEKRPDAALEVLGQPREKTIAHANGEVDYQVKASGLYGVTWRVESKRGKGYASQGVNMGATSMTIEVGAFDDLIRFAPQAPTQSAVDRALRRLR